MRVEQRTVCPYDCPDSCGLIATIERTDCEERFICMKGDPEHPHTKGFLCGKKNHYQRMVCNPERILYPMKRVGQKGEGLFERISWSDAMEEITSRWKKIIESYGAESILPYSSAGTMGVVQRDCGEAFFHYMGASKIKRTICTAGKSAGWKAVMGDSMGMPAHKMEKSDFIIVWGSHMAATRIHEIPYVNAARKNGARVILIDVYASATRAFCDDLILIRPGTDGALALAMLHVLEEEGLTDAAFIRDYVQGYEELKRNLSFYTPDWASEITGIDRDRIIELARMYGKSSKPSILLGSGLSRQQNGAMSVRCIAALPAFVGSWRRGYGICGLKQSGTWGDSDRITRPDFDRNGSRTLNMMQLATALNVDKIDPVVHSLYVYCSNPVNVTANQSELRRQLMREDLFTVVHERFLTDTARYADIILPAVFALESYDVYEPYGYNGIQYAKKVMDPPGECRSNWDTFSALATAMDYEEPYFTMTEEEVCMKYLDPSHGQLKDFSENEWNLLMDGYAVERQLDGSLDIRTNSGKIEIYNPSLEDALIGYRPLKKDDRYPIHLVASPNMYTLNSTFTSQEDLLDKRGKMSLLISSEDARAREIENGDIICCKNSLAEVEFIARIHEDILAGTAVAEGVYPIKRSLNGYTVNALFSEELSDLGEATTMNGNFIEIMKKV